MDDTHFSELVESVKEGAGLLTKKCSRCRQELPVSAFPKDKARKDGLYFYCRECLRLYQKEYRKKEEFKETKKKWESANADKLREQNRILKRKYSKTEKYRQYRHKYKVSDKGKLQNIIDQNKRRAHKLNQIKTLTTNQWRIILGLYSGKCAYCGSKKEIQLDHVIPVSKGGGTTITNVVPACKSCNTSKRNKLLTEWMSA